jgi:hypothetical protein
MLPPVRVMAGTDSVPPPIPIIEEDFADRTGEKVSGQASRYRR